MLMRYQRESLTELKNCTVCVADSHRAWLNNDGLVDGSGNSQGSIKITICVVSPAGPILGDRGRQHFASTPFLQRRSLHLKARRGKDGVAPPFLLGSFVQRNRPGRPCALRPSCHHAPGSPKGPCRT